MTVTGIEAVTKTRFKVCVDGEFAFVLYKGELSRYHLRENENLAPELYEKIKKEVVLKRAKLRALHLLNDMSRTESQLRTKLKQGLYTDDIIEQTMEYVRSFGYIGDADYAGRYIMSRQESRSRKEIYAELCRKGLDKEIIDSAMEAYCQEDGETKAIQALLRKKRYIPGVADESETRKIYAYLARKGFSYTSVQQVIQEYDCNA